MKDFKGQDLVFVYKYCYKMHSLIALTFAKTYNAEFMYLITVQKYTIRDVY